MADNGRIFNGKRFEAWQEYTDKRVAKREQKEMQARGYLTRITYSKWATLFILWVRKKGR